MGLGRTRHIEVRYLWLQEAVRKRRLEIRKIRGELNPADALTKPKGLDDLKGLLGSLRRAFKGLDGGWMGHGRQLRRYDAWAERLTARGQRVDFDWSSLRDHYQTVSPILTPSQRRDIAHQYSPLTRIRGFFK